MTNDGYLTVLIVGPICAVLLTIFIIVVIYACIKWRYCDRCSNSESRTVRQNTENWNKSIAMSQIGQTENPSGIEMAERNEIAARNESTGNGEEQVFQIQYTSPALEPSAPPLPPEYYIEYT